MNRRDFLKTTAITASGTALLGGYTFAGSSKIIVKPIKAAGPASRYIPKVKAAFVRRKEEYGMLWPGAIYDGDAARDSTSCSSLVISRMNCRISASCVVLKGLLCRNFSPCNYPLNPPETRGKIQ